MSESQSGDGYKCECGFISDDLTNFRKHILQGVREDGKGVHKSAGRVNLATGEITMPPYEQRTDEQKRETLYSKKPTKKSNKKENTPSRSTDFLNNATEVKFVPRIYTTTFTPIMQQGWHAAVNILGWRHDMPFENFLDTVIFRYFKSIGIPLGEYHVDERLVQWLREQQSNPVSNDIGKSDEGDPGETEELVEV